MNALVARRVHRPWAEVHVLHKRLAGFGIGAALGLGAGAVWWFVWGCRVCQPDGGVSGPLVASVVVGAVLGAWLIGEQRPTDLPNA